MSCFLFSNFMYYTYVLISLKDNNFYIQGQLFGEMKNFSEIEIEFDTPGFNIEKVVGPSTMAYSGPNDIQIDGEKVIVEPISNYYILFGKV